jgi:hypothetical protein
MPLSLSVRIPAFSFRISNTLIGAKINSKGLRKNLLPRDPLAHVGAGLSSGGGSRWDIAAAEAFCRFRGQFGQVGRFAAARPSTTGMPTARHVIPAAVLDDRSHDPQHRGDAVGERSYLRMMQLSC